MQPAATSKKKLSWLDVATALGCSEKSAQSRLSALGYTTECGRCGGSGRFSYNQVDGDRCYGCNGRKVVFVKLTKKIIAEAKARQDAGELAPYFARSEAVKAARAALAPVLAAFEAEWKHGAVHTAYNAAYKSERSVAWHTGVDNGAITPAHLAAATMVNSAHGAVHDAIRAHQRGELTSPDVLAAIEWSLAVVLLANATWTELHGV